MGGIGNKAQLRPAKAGAGARPELGKVVHQKSANWNVIVCASSFRQPVFNEQFFSSCHFSIECFFSSSQFPVHNFS